MVSDINRNLETSNAGMYNAGEGGGWNWESTRNAPREPGFLSEIRHFFLSDFATVRDYLTRMW